MVSELQYVTAAVLRARCHNVNSQDYSDASLDAIITRWEHNLHIELGRAISAPFLIAEDVYETVQTAVKEGAASEVMFGYDETKEDAQKAFDMYKYWIQKIQEATVTGVSGNQIAVNSDGPWQYGALGPQD